MKKYIVLLVAFLTVSLSSFADSLSFDDIWARTCRTGSTSAIYFEVTNNSDEDEVLLDAHTDVASMTEIHKTVTENGISQMVHINRLVIPANNKVTFKPKGLHIMLMGMKQALKSGDIFYLELEFKNSGTKIYKVKVK